MKCLSCKKRITLTEFSKNKVECCNIKYYDDCSFLKNTKKYQIFKSWTSRLDILEHCSRVYVLEGKYNSNLVWMFTLSDNEIDEKIDKLLILL